MLLYLMQHGLALPKEAAPEEPLSPMGRELVTKAGQMARRLDIGFDAIACSPKLRARQTAEIMAKETGFPVEDIASTPLLKAMNPAVQTVDFLNGLNGAQSVLVAGHMPNLAKLATLIITGDDRPKIEIQNAGLLCIECSGHKFRNGTLKFSINSRHFALMR
ncbi:SixA phosphatase family protein [Desulfobaculum bizertense]|uniref:Phosphohistidine phosphatase, SixA n=1 Tax=Desulfobaculum bizertense DSM 18034 TaxID=1121442 RepID=A0A1T4WVB3_9BACT|nr:histidine phosphatase family protein [Desulfobaculum bizertense]SKA81320.1 phosphohistidine phosphatase, SixA [Desulfobaculum bizertense DSM 18034]